MDTKLKNRLKIFAWLVMFTYGLSGVLMPLAVEHDYVKTSYFQTDDFEYHLKDLFRYIYTFDIYYKTRDEIINSAEESEEEIDAFYSQLESYRSVYERYKNTFQYYLKDTETERVYTNLDIENKQSVKDYFREENMRIVKNIPSSTAHDLGGNNPLIIYGYEEIANYITANNHTFYEGYVGISRNITETNFIIREAEHFKYQRTVFWIYTAGAVIALVISLLVNKKREILSRVNFKWWEKFFHKIPIDASLVVLLFTAVPAIDLFFDYSFLTYGHQILNTAEGILYHLIFLTALLWLFIIQIVCLYPRIKDGSSIRESWKHSLIAKFLRIVAGAFLNRRVGTQVFIILTVVFLLGAGTVLVAVDEDFIALYLPLLLVVGLPLFFLILKRTGYFNQIVRNAGALVNGRYEPDLEIKGRSVLAELAEYINKMKYGVQSSQRARAKSERLKTELITNVSHDLRTPLTSIMTYVDLLKNPELPESERSSYIEVIDRKSKRLKTLIDDLFEASKMASGNIKLMKEKIDIVQLLQQALAEYNDSIKESSLQFRIQTPEQPVYAFVDGQKLWRVFENLISNILKYSLDHSRVYIQVKENEGKVMITFKNVSKYELSENVEELFERFKRGDESRHTEGSGLGLAIAKSIIDLHGGSLDIQVDGDLFKVTIALENRANQS
ncbi:MAG: HAMP domain-containing histidine kinase [Bacillaceae bacterium]|nr:HAMP domain-containing histidine kinase [Bacillaceae bacterium]